METSEAALIVDATDDAEPHYTKLHAVMPFSRDDPA